MKKLSKTIDKHGRRVIVYYSDETDNEWESKIECIYDIAMSKYVTSLGDRLLPTTGDDNGDIFDPIDWNAVHKDLISLKLITQRELRKYSEI
jgi:hypothetical protein